MMQGGRIGEIVIRIRLEQAGTTMMEIYSVAWKIPGVGWMVRETEMLKAERDSVRTDRQQDRLLHQKHPANTDTRQYLNHSHYDLMSEQSTLADNLTENFCRQCPLSNH